MQRSEVACDEISMYPTDRLESFASRAVGYQARQTMPRECESGSAERVSMEVYMVATKRRALLSREEDAKSGGAV